MYVSELQLFAETAHATSFTMSRSDVNCKHDILTVAYFLHHNIGYILVDVFRIETSLTITSSSAIAERPRDARVTSIRKIAKWNF